MTTRGPRNIIALDLLRFGSALLVLAFHWGHGFAHSPPPGGQALLAGMPVDATWSPVFNSGWIGVEVFFVLSGFVIAWSAEGSDPGPFAARRFLRLIPCAWICATITASAMLAFSGLPANAVSAAWAGSILFWPMFGIDPSYWTLALEVNFYLLIALSLLGGSSLERVERVGVLLGITSATYWVASGIFDVPPATSRVVQLTLLPHGCFFALGIMIRARQQLGWLSLRSIFLVPICLAVSREIEAHRLIMNGDDPAHLSALLLFGLLVLPILLAPRLQSWLERHVASSTSVTIGLMTYPIYLLHQELGAILIGTLLRLGLSYWPAAAVAMIFMLALSWTIVRFGEPALRAWLRSFLPNGAVWRARPQDAAI